MIWFWIWSEVKSDLNLKCFAWIASASVGAPAWSVQVWTRSDARNDEFPRTCLPALIMCETDRVLTCQILFLRIPSRSSFQAQHIRLPSAVQTSQIPGSVQEVCGGRSNSCSLRCCFVCLPFLEGLDKVEQNRSRCFGGDLSNFAKTGLANGLGAVADWSIEGKCVVLSVQSCS